MTDQERLRQDARSIWQAGVDAVRGDACVEEALDEVFGPSLGEIAQFPRIVVAGGGKASTSMVVGLERWLAQRGYDLGRVSGVVCVPDDMVCETRAIRLVGARPLGANRPTQAAVLGTTAMLDVVRSARERDLLIALISGGGSALLCAPADGISLEDKVRTFELLEASGATIAEINAVRKHLSKVKGGGLIRAFAGGGALTLVVSDVIGDPLDVIASGPTVPDPTTFEDTLRVLEDHGVIDDAPPCVVDRLRRGAQGLVAETLKQEPVSPTGAPMSRAIVVANNERAMGAAAERASTMGYRVVNLGSAIAGDTQRVAASLAQSISDAARAASRGERLCVLSGGETTVTLPKEHGRGGRNQELALSLAMMLRAEPLHSVVLSGGTDGEDGPTDAAGAICDVGFLDEAARLGLSAEDALLRHDTYTFFASAAGRSSAGLVKTGLTGTNVMDLRVVLALR
jgi:hydroxypyruvate reductase/glycerate 2-kinase